MTARVTLLGLDFGSTTSGALVSTARVLQNGVTGRSELADLRTVHRAGPVFTPFAEGALDLAALARTLDGWLAQAGAEPVWGGGALVTGLAARAANADALVALVRRRLGDAVVACARDPGLESWLAFMGSCRALSLAEPARPMLNLDIGGGTANFALGRAGEVAQVGCVAVGARHVRVAPGTYRVVGTSPAGRMLLDRLGIAGRPGDLLAEGEVARLVTRQVEILEAMATGRAIAPDAVALVELPLCLPPGEPPVITFSGGVGELVYRLRAGAQPEGRTPFGDLGVELAHAVLASPLLSAHAGTHVPPGAGHATVSGLALFSTEVSGATLYLPHPEVLPLADLPVVARLDADAPEPELARALALVARGTTGGCIAFTLATPSLERVRALGAKLAAALEGARLPADRPVVLLVSGNVGKTLGSFATAWGRLPVRLVVIDEVAGRRAHFVSLGRERHGVVPVSFHGLSW